MKSDAKRVVIDAFPESAFRHLDYDAVVCIDVLRSTTLIVGSVAQGRTTIPAATAQEARSIASRVPGALLAGEFRGQTPEGFEMQDSPAALARLEDVDRPLVVAATSGTQLIANAANSPAVYIACLRNLTITAQYLAARHHQVAILGAGYGDEFRCEDQMAAAWIARDLMRRGFEAGDISTATLVERWGDTDASLVGWGKSAESLRRLGHGEDVEFALSHVDDVAIVCRYTDGEVRAVDTGQIGTQIRDEAAGRGQVVGFDAGRRGTAATQRSRVVAAGGAAPSR